MNTIPSPFEWRFQDAGATGVMASYNAWNGVPMAINPVLRNAVIGKWHVDVISSDGGAVTNLVKWYHRFPTQKDAVVATLKAGINQYLDTYKDELREAVKEGLVTGSDLDEALKRKFRVTLKLGLLDPPERVAYSKVHDGTPPWDGEEDQAISRRMALESLVLLKNSDRRTAAEQKQAQIHRRHRSAGERRTLGLVRRPSAACH